jgi:hypothetical protein
LEFVFWKTFLQGFQNFEIPRVIPEKVDPGHCGPGSSVEECPGAEQEDEQLEREPDQDAITFDLGSMLHIIIISKIFRQIQEREKMEIFVPNTSIHLCRKKSRNWVSRKKW